MRKLRKWDRYMQKKKKERKNLDHFLTSYTKINSKWINHLNVRSEAIKLFPANTGSKLDILSNILLAHLGQRNKRTNNRMGQHILKDVCTAKETTHKRKRQPTERDRASAGDTASKRLVPTLHEELMQLSTKKPDNLINKWAT